MSEFQDSSSAFSVDRTCFLLHLHFSPRMTRNGRARLKLAVSFPGLIVLGYKYKFGPDKIATTGKCTGVLNPPHKVCVAFLI